MKNLDMKKKIILSFSVVVVCFAIAIIFSILGMHATSERYTTFYSVRHQSIMNAKDISQNLEGSRTSLLLACASSSESQIKSLTDEAQTHLATIDTDMAWYDTSYDGDMATVTQFKTELATVKSLQSEVISLLSEGTATAKEEALTIISDDYVPAITATKETLDGFITSETALAKTNYEGSMSSQRTQMIIGVGLSILAVVFAIFMAITLVKSIVVPIHSMMDVMDRMERGDLQMEINYDSKDEFGHLATTIRNAVTSIRNIIKDMDFLLKELSDGNFTVVSSNREMYIGDYAPLLTSIRGLKVNVSEALSQINEASDQVSSGADQVSSGAQALSQGATEQASSVQELAATIHEISSRIEQNADSARTASEKADIVKNHAEESSRRMQEMLSAMENISSTSGEIGKIIKTIEDIAFQTNILALNAAVEAARAGTAGKGFAVVADEVRNLAGKSAEASKNTATLIESSLRAVEDGTKIANDTAQALTEVVTGVEDVTVTIDLISSASEEQADATKQVTLGIDQISSVVQTNSATAEQSAAASEQLSGQAHVLKSLVAQFKLENSKGFTPAPAPIPDSMPASDMNDSYSNTSYMDLNDNKY